MSLGISVYPGKGSFEKDKKLIELVSNAGYKRVFTCFLSLDIDKEQLYLDSEREKVFALIKKYSSLVHDNNMVISADVNPEVLSVLNIKNADLQIFKEMGIDIIRLDGAYAPVENVKLINNNLGLIIEMNLSNPQSYKELIDLGANKNQLYTCHNFYPQPYTGLDESNIFKFSNAALNEGLKTAAFLSSNEENTFGPWPVSEGLPTMEIQRYKPIDRQIRYMKSLNLFDDLLFGNCYPSHEEIITAKKYNEKPTTVKVKFDCNNIEKEIAIRNIHIYRPDGNRIMIRSSVTRNNKVIANNIKDKFTFGDVFLVNDNQKHYEGELEIALQDIVNDGSKNYIGKISELEMQILLNLKPAEEFILEE